MNSYATKFFNPNLFVIKDAPMKFFLDGYGNHEVNKMAKIIEAFGGKLSMPDGQTVIFSEPGCPVTRYHNRFHIRCLHDSIIAGQFQDLEQYRIPLFKTESFGNKRVHQSMDLGTNLQHTSSHLVNQAPDNSLVHSCKIVSVPSQANEEEQHSSASSDVQIESDKSSWSIDVDSETLVHNNNKSSKLKKCSPNATNDNGHVFSYPVIKNVIKDQSNDSKWRKMKHPALSNTSIKSNVQSYESRWSTARNRWSKKENELMIKYIIDHDAMLTATSRRIWLDMEADRILVNPIRNAKAMAFHFNEYLRFRLPQYIQDSAILEQFKQMNEEKNYSKNENRQIIKYLSDHKAIRKSYGEEIWRQMEAGHIFLVPYRSAESLRQQFIDHIQHNVSTYTRNMDIIRKIEMLRKRHSQ